MKTPEQIDEEFECQKCHALLALGDGLIPTKYCNLCAQELVESMSDRLQAVEAERDLLIQMLDHVGYPEVSRRQLRELLQPAQKEQQ